MGGVQLLTADNYPVWSKRMIVYLGAKGLLDYIDEPSDSTAPSSATPVVSESSGDSAGSSETSAKSVSVKLSIPGDVARSFVFDPAKDARTKQKIVKSINDGYLYIVYKAPTAKAAWAKLRETFQAKTAANAMQHRRDLTTLRKEQVETMEDYIFRARRIADALNAVGQTVAATEISTAVLAGLPPAYASTVEVLANNPAAQDIDVLLSQLLSAEKRIQAREAQTTAALYARPGKPNPRPQQENNQQQDDPHAHIQCRYCKCYGHYASDCPKKRKQQSAANVAAPGQVLAL
jgi:gag-polypeptide of LTR copia-type